jgi:ATP-dependent Clp protease protease subunit
LYLSEKILRIKNKNNNSAELLLYGDILSRDLWWLEENYISPQKVIEELKEIGDIDTLDVRINSDGGDLISAQAILSGLKRFDATVNVYIDGIAASAATIIAMAGDKIIIPSNALMMVHNPLVEVYGNADELRELADRLETLRESMIAAYMKKINISEEELIELLDNETFLTADDCVEKGFADEIESEKIAASISNNQLIMNGIKHNLNKFKQPDKLVAKYNNNINNKSKKGVKENMAYKEFKTEEDFNSFKNDYKKELKENEDFINSIRNGYISIENIINEFKNLKLEGEDLKDIKNSVKGLKSNYEKEKEKFENYKKEVKEERIFNSRKTKMVNAGLEVEDENKEEITNMSKKAFNMIIKAAKLNKKNDNDIDNDFDPNLNLIDDESEDEDLEIVASLF